MKIYLHIGTEKTGTTSIQVFLAKNRKMLLEHNVLYAEALNLPNNVNLAIAFQDKEKKDDLRINAGVLTEKNINEFTQRITKNLQDEIVNTKPNILIISSEHLSSRFSTPSEIQRLYAFLKGFSNDIRVVLYLRRQDKFFESLYSTSIKSGSVMDFKFPKNIKHDFRYLEMLKMWEGVFNKKNIIVRVFEKSQLYKANVIEDFMQICQISMKNLKIDIEEKNLSFGQKKLYYLKEFNKFVPKIKDNKMNPLRDNIVNILENVDIEDKPFLFQTKIRHEILKKFEDDNNTILKEYFNNKDSLFENVDLTNGSAENINLTTEEAIKISAKIWENKILEQNNNLLFVTCELQLERKQFHEAKITLDEFKENFPYHPRKYYLIAKMAYLANDIEFAKVEIQKAIKLKPNDKFFKALLRDIIKQGE